MKRNLVFMVVLVVAAAVVGFTVAMITVSSQVDNKSMAMDGGHRHYAYPANVKEARSECFRIEREARGIPGEKRAYLEWWDSNVGTPAQLDWSAAYQMCIDNNPVPGGEWNWDAMVYLGTW